MYQKLFELVAGTCILNNFAYKILHLLFWLFWLPILS